MNKQYKIGDKVLVRGIVNSEVSNGGIHVLHDGVDAFYTLDQIDEPAKVVVPEFMDGYFRYCKYRGMSLFEAMEYAQNKEAYWITENEEVFSKAFFDGYEVGQEKEYVINLGKHIELSIYLRKTNKSLYPEMNDWSTTGAVRFAEKFTESKIKQDFKWAWDAGFAEPVEVQEVK